MNYDDETLMAYADGELDEAQRAAIAAAHREGSGARAARASSIARCVPKLRVPSPRCSTSPFPTVCLQPRCRAAERPTRDAEVVQFPRARRAADRAAWGGREWVAMAASLVLGVLISWQWLAPAEPVMTASQGALVARGDLASALDQQRASTQRDSDPVQIGVTFRTQDGRYCRSFALRAAAHRRSGLPRRR